MQQNKNVCFCTVYQNQNKNNSIILLYNEGTPMPTFTNRERRTKNQSKILSCILAHVKNKLVI